ncbi:MAG: hypothetical protein JW982_12540 [Spirochaetes bacterium]|nr:hypothetical protein [Spirochaetota bacterium]
MLIKALIPYYPYYIFSLAVIILLTAVTEIIFPSFIFSIWMKWINSRFFRLQGIAYMVGGFPLTQMRGSAAGFIMLIIGLIIVLTGPFILFYPDKFLSMINSEKELLNNDHKSLIYGDAAMKIAASTVLFFNSYKIILDLF